MATLDQSSSLLSIKIEPELDIPYEPQHESGECDDFKTINAENVWQQNQFATVLIKTETGHDDHQNDRDQSQHWESSAIKQCNDAWKDSVNYYSSRSSTMPIRVKSEYDFTFDGETESTDHKLINCEVSNKSVGNTNEHIIDNVLSIQKNEYICDKCDFRCKAKRQLKKHYDAKHDRRPRYECEFCGQKFFTRSPYCQHRKQIHQEEYEKLVSQIESTSMRVSTNIIRYSDENTRKIVKCALCSEESTNNQNHALHMTLKHPDKPIYICDECEKVYLGKRAFRNHFFQTHLNKDKFGCEFCIRKFCYSHYLLSHIRKAHPNEYAKFLERRKNDRLKRQERQSVKSAEKTKKRFGCLKCDKSFCSAELLKDHYTKHEGKPKYECTDCGATFFNYGQFGRHRKLDHTLLNNCNRCQIHFTKRSDFEEHKRMVHPKTKPNRYTSKKIYSCHLCEKVCTERKLFLDHLSRHEGKPRHECPMCHKKFYDSSDFYRHKRSIH